MRGKVKRYKVYVYNTGITPAYAGKSGLVRSTTSSLLGSPPRMRGKVPVDQCNTAANRITPAYAGKSVIMPIITLIH